MTATTEAPTVTGKDHIDPASAFVPVQTRSERKRSFEPADFGRPKGVEVDWKHSPLQRLAPLLDDAAFDADAVSQSVTAPEGVVVASLAIGAAPRGEVFTPEDLPAALAWKHSAEALHVLFPQDVEASEAVVVEMSGTDAARRGAAHVVLEARPNSRGTVILRHRGAAALAENVEIIVRDGASLTVITVQEWDDAAVHASAHQARVGRAAALRHIVVSFGGGVVRLNPSVELAGEGAEGDLFGLSFADSGQHLESQVYLHHKGPQTRGDVLYKGALQGDTARSVWIGDVLIGPDATGTDSYEANRNLVLTPGARADSIPNLEIETGDIQGAGHASATGRFDDEQLFYLQARGIPEDEARRLVVIGFLAEIVQKIGDAELEAHLSAAIEAELAGGLQ
jgi:Fe-S cluster assembly protein SufD